MRAGMPLYTQAAAAIPGEARNAVRNQAQMVGYQHDIVRRILSGSPGCDWNITCFVSHKRGRLATYMQLLELWLHLHAMGIWLICQRQASKWTPAAVAASATRGGCRAP